MSAPVEPDAPAAAEEIAAELLTPMQTWAWEIRESFEALTGVGFTTPQAMQLMVAGIHSGWFDGGLEAPGDPDLNGEND